MKRKRVKYLIVCISVLSIYGFIYYTAGKNLCLKSYKHDLMEVNPAHIINATQGHIKTNNIFDIVCRSNYRGLKYKNVVRSNNIIRVNFEGRNNYVGGYIIYMSNSTTNVSYFDNNLGIVSHYKANGKITTSTNEIHLSVQE